MMFSKLALPVALLLTLGTIPQSDPNRPVDASSVLAFPVPDALIMQNGQRVKNADEWMHRRRPEILRLFSDQVYGRTPAKKPDMQFQIESVDPSALLGAAIRKQITILFSNQNDGPRMHLLLYEPAHSPGRVPAIVGLNFEGNQTVNSDPGILLHDVWIADPAERQERKELRHHIKQRASEGSRGHYGYRWQVERVLSHGYALATVYCGDIEPDFDGGFPYGVRALYLRPGETGVDSNEWGALGAWAWGLSRIVDYLESDASIDARHIAVIGHSRLGKAAMWAAAQDGRFSLVISNESGMGGVSLYRAKTGETIEHLNVSFPYWFCENFHAYTGHPDRVPVDGNLLLSLIAPRPVYVASAEQDHFSNPKAEFLSAVLAGQVYQLFGEVGLGTNTFPALNSPVMHTIGYHVRSGVHEVTEFDWDQYLKFADLHFNKRG